MDALPGSAWAFGRLEEEVLVRQNRSMPMVSVIPELVDDDVEEAARWLCAALGLHSAVDGRRSSRPAGAR